MCYNVITCENQECIYTVYSLWDGIVDDEENFCDIEKAHSYFDVVMRGIRVALDLDKPDVVEVTVHLYDTVLGNLIREVHVETGNELAR